MTCVVVCMKTTPGLRLAQLAEEAVGAPDPLAALRLVSELRRELEAFERRQVADALASGSSFAAVARELGISRQAVHRRFRDLAAPDPPLLTSPDALRVLRHARAEAGALGAGDVRGEHIVLAILRAGDLPVAHALFEAGATLPRARSHVEGAMPQARLFGRDAGGDGGIRRLLEGPARAARARGRGRIEVEDLLHGCLEEPSGGAARLLRALGVDVEALRAGT